MIQAPYVYYGLNLLLALLAMVFSLGTLVHTNLIERIFTSVKTSFQSGPYILKILMPLI